VASSRAGWAPVEAVTLPFGSSERRAEATCWSADFVVVYDRIRLSVIESQTKFKSVLERMNDVLGPTGSDFLTGLVTATARREN